LIRDESLSTEDRVLMCKAANTLVQRDEEKKILLGVLGTVPAVDTLSIAMAYLDDPTNTDEGSFAAVAISEKIVDREPDKVVAALQKVMKATNNKEVINRAKAILDKANKAAER